MPRLPDLFPEAGPARRGMRGWRIPLGRGRVCARASALQKCRCPAQFSCLAPLSPLSAEAATRFSPGPALSRRREACSSVLRRLCPREVSRPKWLFFCGAAPAFRRLRRATFFCPGAERGQPGNFTSGGLAMASRRAACPSFPAGGLPRRRVAHPSRKGRSAAIFGTGRAGSLRNRRAATAPARDGALCVEPARRLLCAALSPPAWDARAAEGALRGAEVRLAASGVRTAGRSQMQKLPVIGKPHLREACAGRWFFCSGAERGLR